MSELTDRITAVLREHRLESPLETGWCCTCGEIANPSTHPVHVAKRVVDALNDPMLSVIGRMSVKAQEPPPDTPQLAWRTGYQNALSDLIAELYPDLPGGRRLTMDELAAEDERRGV